MNQMPDCLHRRKKALDRLIRELSGTPCGSNVQCRNECGDKVAARLMRDFWNILKEDPSCNLAHEVQNRLCARPSSRSCDSCSHRQHIACYMAGRKRDDGDDQRRDALNKVKTFCKNNPDPKSTPRCCTSQSPALSDKDIIPLTKILCNLKEAASFDKQCDAKITALMAAQKELRDQIQNLEKRENAGIQLLKQADCMWTCMEDAYKKKVEDSLERQKTLLEELKEVETSATKWRKNKKDLESQLKNIEKCEKEIKEKINLKTNDLKCVNNEIDDFQKRIDKNKKEIDAATKSLTTKKQASDLKVANLASDIAKKQTVISDETKNKEKKERDGINFVKDAREDLQKLCRVLLQKRIENEDLRAERDALNLEIDLLNKSHDACQDKCAQKQQSILEEIKLTDQEIAKYKSKCVKCHQCTDTIDVRKYCTDCPRCSVERDCLYEDDKCRPDDTLDCVCMSVKEKLLDNVFENMYTVLERQAKTEKGKAVGGAILKCLKKSRNGKLDAATRKLLQDFVLTTVKQHLNLTIVGGAVKTRCEMDPETHKQLMLCLKQVTVVGPPKEDKGTASKKESCRRWGGECNCPKGGKGCVCDKIAPPLPPEEPSIPEGVDNAETCKVSFCPRKTSTSCGPDVAMQAVPSRVGAEVAALKSNACKDSTCAYPKNMRAAQCVLGPEILNSPTKGSRLSVPFRPEIPVLDEKFCDCSISSVKSCACRDLENSPRDRIIEEVMGRYIEVQPIDKVANVGEIQFGEIAKASGSSTGYIISRPLSSMSDEFVPQREFVQNENVQRYTTAAVDANNKDHNVVKPFPKGDFYATPTNEYGNKVTTGIAVLLNKDNSVNRAVHRNTLNEKTDTTNLTSKDKNGDIGGKTDDNIKSLINNIIVPDGEILDNANFMSQVEFVTVDSFVRRIEILTKYGRDDLSDVTRDEIEVETQLLQEPDLKSKYAKKLKVVICEGCNKENCDILWERALKAVCPPFNEDSKLVHKNNDDVLLVSKDKNNVEEIVAEKNENHTNILEHIINLTSSKSGTLMTELDEKIIEFIENGINENKLAYVKNISPESIVVGFDDNDECVQNRSRISIRKTSSGSKYLEIRSAKNSVKSELNVKSNNYEKLVHSKSMSPERLRKTCEKSSSCNFHKNDIKKLKKKSLDYKNRNNITKSAKKDEEKDSTQANKLKIKISNNIIEAPAILKLTASQNFKVVMNKEYENWFSQQLKECIKNGTCKFKLHKTNSGNYLIDLDENDEANTRHLLKMTSSKSFKIVTDRENSKNKCESKECEDLSTRGSFDLHVKSKSDSKVYKKDKKVPDSQTLMQSSESLKKTPSGKLIVVLDKDTKTNLINNLKNYLVDCNGFVPVTKTESGEIIIDFNSNKSTLSKGSLKITASGNIYAIIDESLLKSTDQNQRHNKNCIYSNIRGSKHLINKNRYPNNKSIATTCNGIPNESTCDVVKCVCHNLQCLAKNIEKHSEQGNICTPRKSFLDWTDVKTNDIRKARRSNLNTLKDYPHIVIKPNSNDSNVKSKEECFYVVETGCSFHKNRYVGVSNELLKISGPCNVSPDNTINRNDSKLLDQCKVIDDSYWDSLRYLPPQLPAFLKDVEYK